MSIADDSLWTRQKAGHLNRSQKELVGPLHTDNTIFGRRKRKKKVFLFVKLYKKKKSLLFVLPTVKMRIIKTR